MKGLFPKSSVHPATENGTGSTDSSKGDVSFIIPITSELNYFERRLNTHGNLTEFEPLSELNTFVIRKYQRIPDETEDTFNEPCKYEVLDEFGHLVYFIAEQTEYFIQGTTCLSKPFPMEFNVSTPGGDSVMKFYLEFGRNGYSTKITTKQKDRELGTISRRCGFIFPYKYTIKDSSDKTIMNIKPKDCCCCTWRFNLFSSSLPINQFGIYSSSSSSRRRRRKNICKGKIVSEEIESLYSLSLFHGIDSRGKSLLISAVILIDLQMSPRSKARLFNCHVLSCLPQFIASICFYAIFLALLTTFFMLIVILK